MNGRTNAQRQNEKVKRESHKNTGSENGERSATGWKRHEGAREVVDLTEMKWHEEMESDGRKS